MHACTAARLFKIICCGQELSAHALYMRLKRLCTKTQSGRLNVPDDVYQQWLHGSRDELLLALTRSLKVHGFSATAATRKAVRVGDIVKMFCMLFHSHGCLSAFH